MTRSKSHILKTSLTFTHRAWMELMEYRRSFPPRDGVPMPVGVALDRLLWTHPALIEIREAHTAEVIAKREAALVEQANA